MSKQKARDRVDRGLARGVSYGQGNDIEGQGSLQAEGQGRQDRQGNLGTEGQGEKGNGIVICEAAWSEFILVAQYLFRHNSETELADVFEFFRMEDLGGIAYSKAVLERATREVVTDCGPWAA